MTSSKEGFTLSKSKIIENVTSLVVSVLIAWLCTLHVLVPEPDLVFEDEEFEVLIPYRHTLLNPSLSSWLVISIVGLLVMVGFLVWNWFCVINIIKRFYRAIKDCINILVPLVIGDVVAYVTACNLASIAPPIWVTLSVFCLVGVGFHLIARLIISQVVHFIFYKLFRYVEIQNAYSILEVSSTATYKEVCKAYTTMEKSLSSKNKENLPLVDHQIVKTIQPRDYMLRQAVKVIAHEKLRNPKFSYISRCLRSLW